jgi:hypothetical protein
VLVEVEENIIPNRLSEDIRDLIMCGTVLEQNEPIWVRLSDNIIPKMTIFDGNKLCLRSKFWILGHCNARLIVFSNFDNKFG